MCGIAGYWGTPPGDGAGPLLQAMNDALAHRGPDGEGVWVGPGVGFGHRRLAIIDLETGAQPMSSVEGRYRIVLNGEIYNHRELRRELETAGYSFRTRSDTEVIPAVLDHWGVAEGLLRLRGMFAFALYDERSRSLLLARDRVGIKPLYVGYAPGLVLFASEPKALLRTGLMDRRADFAALMDFFTLGEPLSPRTAWRSIRELPPGTWIRFEPDGRESSGRYWSWDATHKRDYSEGEAVERLRGVLKDSLRAHLESDVPLGAFLSGGIDSSVLVALLSGSMGVKLDSFNVGFGEADYDESAHARVVADSCGIPLHQLRVGAGEGEPDLFCKIAEQYDQPFGDSSAIPTYLVCREMAQHHKVVLSGDGGDEMFGGYPRYQLARDLVTLGSVPGGATAAALAGHVLSALDPNRSRKLKKAARFARLSRPAMLCALHSYFLDGDLDAILAPELSRQVGGEGSTVERFAAFLPLDLTDAAEQLMGGEISSLLHADYLRKVDVASSAHGLEVRTPYLDPEVFRFSAELPMGLKVRRGSPKYLLRALARKLLPHSVVDRPKQGFGIPLDRWAGPRMTSFLRDLLTGPGARSRDVLQPTAVRALLQDFGNGRSTSDTSRYQAYQKVFMLSSFELWMRRWSPSLA